MSPRLAFSAPIAAWVLCAATHASVAAASFVGDEPEVETAEDADAWLERVRGAMLRQRWERAYDAVRREVERNPRSPVLGSRATEIEEIVARCAFALEYRVPSRDALMGGRLTERGARWTLEYDPETAWDFVDWRQAPGTWTWEELRSAPADGRPAVTRLHPARTRGDVRIQIRGDAHDPRAAVLVGVQRRDRSWVVALGGEAEDGRGVACELLAVDGAEVRTLDRAEESPWRAGQPFEVDVQVEEGAIHVFCGERHVLSATSSGPLDGYVGMRHIEPSHATLDGLFEAGWLEARRAAWERAERRSFQEESRRPDWLRVLSETKRPRPGSSPMLPGPPGVLDCEYVHQVLRYLGREDFESGLRFLELSPRGGVPEATRCYLQALMYKAQDRFEPALRAAVRTSSLDPDFQRARALQADLYDSLARPDLADVIYRDLVERGSLSSDVDERYAWFLLARGEPDQARRVVDRSHQRGHRSSELDRLARILVQARFGPRWAVSYEHTTRHYRVVSNMDRRTCVSVGASLERSLERASRTFAALPDGTPRMQVYVFADEEGYLEYCRGLGIALPMHTAGLFSRYLQQLLLWNVSNEEALHRTVRHEGMHQYLDAVIGASPRWFDEGLAECAERVPEGRGKWRSSAVDPRAVDALLSRPERIRPLPMFLHQDVSGFLAEPAIHYPQAWALMHFLLYGEGSQRVCFQRMFDALRDGRSADDAVADAFGQEDLDALDRRFRLYVESLRRP